LISVLIGLIFGAFDIEEPSLPSLDASKADSLLLSLPHVSIPADNIVLRGKEPMLELPIIHAGGYFRYAFDLYQLDRNHFKQRIVSNLEALTKEMELVGDQGKVKASRRVEEIGDIEKAIEEGLEPDSVLKLFAFTQVEIKTLVAEYDPCGVYAYDLGAKCAAMGVRLAFYPGCSDELCQTLVLSNINLLIEKVERLDSEHWNEILLSLPRDDKTRLPDIINTLEFLSALSYYPPVTGDALAELFSKLELVYKVFGIEFVV
jgi:hypothetical protein